MPGFVRSTTINVWLREHLAERGIDEQQAVDLRRRLAVFADDWDRPEMDVYDGI